MKHHPFIYLFISLMSIFALVVVFVLGIMAGFQLTEKEYVGTTIPTLSMLGTWVGAFATCSAVIVSLWLALLQLSKDKVVLKCHVNNVVTPPDLETTYISLSVVSTGNKPAKIRSIGWIGKEAKTAVIVKDFYYTSAELPTTVTYGEDLVLMHTPDFYGYLKGYVEDFLENKYDSLRCVVHTTTESIEVMPSSEVITSIKNANKLSQQDAASGASA